MPTLTTPPERAVDVVAPRRDRRALVAQPQQLVLAGLLVLEVAVFSFIGGNFFSPDNFFEIQRLGVELGLLALAMTPVIVTGGIDLSVGSLMALSAVLMGMMWRDAGVPIWIAAVATVFIAALAGGLNALLITRLRIPPLIVTLGSYSLFRGLAEGMTRGVVTYTKFPRSFVFLGNGYFGPVPAQVVLLAIAAVAFWVLLHRTTIGRALSAIGYSSDGARHAGIPVERRVALAYVLSGLCAGLAAVVYVAHVDQAKANAGTGYELMAITAVVLGGTSIFGGRGSIAGTIMGLFAIVVLQNGLRMADRPVWLTSHLGGEMAGILTGLLLLLAIGLDWRLSQHRNRIQAPVKSSRLNEEEFEMKNSQLAVLSVVILAAALIVAGGNYMLIKSLPQTSAIGGPSPAPAKQMTIAMMPKSKGNSYFVACQKGAEEAAKELGVNLVWDGPTNTDPAEQNRIVDTWVNRGVDVIAVAVENREGLSTALRKARQKGIKIVTWDADAEPDARDFFVNQATSEGIGQTLVDNAAKAMGGKGDFAIITASLTASNMNEWRKQIEKRLADKYPDMKLLDVRPCDDQKDKAFDEANALLNSRPSMKLIMAICSPAVPGAAEAVKQSGRKDVKVMGLGLPNDNKKYVHEGITDNVVLWNTMDLGYLTVTAAYDLKAGTLKPGEKSLQAGRLGKITVEGDNIVLGRPVTFTKENIDQYDF
ncbi:MAG: permease component of ribose/xylose/arabinose/galactoside ABC-type transporter [Phycisphaerales bacterium]|nr:permease component of ribose/xylose/arabinose/galactoside ABC-type transporter [Phycisphaerales bacterium]